MDLFSDAFKAMLRKEIKKALAEVAPGDKTWLSQQEAAHHCSVTVATIRNWHKQGLKFQRVGKMARYAVSDLDAFVKRHAGHGTVAWVKDALAKNTTRKAVAG